MSLIMCQILYFQFLVRALIKQQIVILVALKQLNLLQLTAKAATFKVKTKTKKYSVVLKIAYCASK